MVFKPNTGAKVCAFWRYSEVWDCTLVQSDREVLSWWDNWNRYKNS